MLTVAVLGRVEVRRHGVPCTVPAGLTTDLLVRLALDAGSAVSVDRLVEDLWPDAATTRRNTLQAKVSQLRRALGDPAALVGGAAGYTLVVEPRAVDALEVVRLAAAGAAQLAAGDPQAAADTGRAGLALLGPEILPATTSAWAVPHRVRLEEARLRLLEDALAARLALGASGELVGELESLVAVHPLRERLWSLLVTSLYRAGRQSDALATHRRVARLLADELGVDPGPELQALEGQVLAHDPGLAAPPTLPATARPGNVPAPATPLVGRADDLGALRGALAAHRLVTLVGPAGVGKTRLATEAARVTAAPGGVWLVRLEGARTASELPAAVADAVPGVDAADVVGDLRGADLVLVLDNCEQVLEAVATLVRSLLDAAPGVRVLATSQRPLGLTEEVVRSLRPLAETDALALLVQRATVRRPSFAVTERTAPVLRRLCRALDGLPLAIELAAARTSVLSVPEIAGRLDDRFMLLADPTSDRPERRRTLVAALAWSYDLLEPDDRRGLWALAPFPAGATMSALEHVLVALGVPAPSVLDVVARLVDRSLMTVDEGTAEVTRYRLLDSVRAFATDRSVEAAAGDAAADALVGWVADLADSVDAGVRGPDQPALVAAVATERPTIEAALERTRTRDPVAGLRIAVGVGWAWVLLDDTLAADRLRAARTAAGDAPRELVVRAGLLEGWLEAMSGDVPTARAELDAARVLAEGDDALVTLARWFAGFVLVQEGRPAEALVELTHCRAAAAREGSAWEEAASVLVSAFAHLALEETAAAREACTQAIHLLEPLGDVWALLHAEGALGGLAQAEHRFADAARHHALAAGSAEKLGFPGAAALHLSNLGRAQHSLGDPAAADTLRRAVAGAERAGDRQLLAASRASLSEVEESGGDA